MSKYDFFTFFDKPVPFKGLLIYPALVTDFMPFYYYSDCLLVDKNSIPDVKVIQMNYLDYILYAANEKENHIFKLFELLKIVLRKPDDIEGNSTLSFTPYYDKDNGYKAMLNIEGNTFTSEEFDILKEIIIEQNLLEPPDETIPKYMREEMKRQKEFRQRLSGFKMCSLEEQINCIRIATSMSYEEIYKMTLRKFHQIIPRVDELIHYQIYKSASMSGFVTFKDKNFPPHWMRDLDKKDRFDGLTIDVEDVKSKLSADGKLNIESTN
jgi:hypothetical protein